MAADAKSNQVDLLTSGIFTVSEAARLIGASPARVRGWIDGYPRTKADPLIENEIGWLNDNLAMSFTNLMEVRFIQKFVTFGVRVKSIRQMACEAKVILDHPHPFATSTVFRTDGRKIFAEIAEKTGDKRMYDLRAKNWTMMTVIEASLKTGVSYDPSGDAIAWRPCPNEAPDVVVSSNQCFGQPHLEDSGIPTRTVLRAFMAEGETVETVAAWYCIAKTQVEQAIRFEGLLGRETLAA